MSSLSKRCAYQLGIVIHLFLQGYWGIFYQSYLDKWLPPRLFPFDQGSMSSRTDIDSPSCDSRFCHLLTVQPQASYLGTLCLSFFNSKKWDKNTDCLLKLLQKLNKKTNMKELCFLRGSCNCKLLVLIKSEERSYGIYYM